MEGKDEFDSGVGFLYKTMLERDPQKRRVKPVQHHLLQLDFGGLGDSSDDSDYNIEGHKDDSDASPDEDDEESHGKSEGSESASEEEEVKEEDVHSEEASTNKDESSNHGTEVIALDSTNCMSLNASAKKKFRVIVCCVCLGDNSVETDEIVECDGCQITVHEGCYGITESQSVASTESSASTEPWFCDACKAGVKPHCELCPNSGGIYKETDTGKWVHIVCALYVPGVAFADVDRLTPVTLFEMSQAKWGAKECTLCEDERFSATGVCICCDAGLCRNYFHVTCAQREGLLSEASPDEEIADPFYAYCKQHVDKSVARIKRRNFLAVQSKVKAKKEEEHCDELEKARVLRKLNHHRQKYLMAKAKRPPPWVPPEKVPRLLQSNPSALRRLMRKAELLGISAQSSASAKDVSKKWHIAPAFTAEFVNYYLDRNSRMKSMRAKQSELAVQQKQRQQQEKELRIKYDQVQHELETLKRSTDKLRDTGQELYSILQDLAQKPIPLPEVFLCRRVPMSPAKRESSKETPFSPNVIHSCGICCQSHDQHLLAKCDKCQLHYHLGCLDPPLTRMPKKTKLFGWQCSECARTDSDSATDQVKENPNAPRRLRDISCIKEPSKYVPFIKEKLKKKNKATKPSVNAAKKALKRARRKSHTLSESESAATVNIPKLKKRAKKSLLSSKAIKCEDKSNAPEKSPEAASPKPPRKVVKKEKEIEVVKDCCVCNEPGSQADAVCCDHCQLCYHFACLDPPCKRSPKVRGYEWVCSICQSDDNEDSETRQAKNKVAAAAVTTRRNSSPERVRPEITRVSIYKTPRSPTRRVVPSAEKLGQGILEKMGQVTVALNPLSDSQHLMPLLKQEKKSGGRGNKIEKISQILASQRVKSSGSHETGQRLTTPPPPTLSPKQKVKVKMDVDEH